LPPQVAAGIMTTVSFAPALWELTYSNGFEDKRRELTARKSFANVYFRYLSDALANNLISYHLFEMIDGGFGGTPGSLKGFKRRIK
jgi:hypothetical protein